jgi:murein DD-endopeptidase MepM/ murein hydrolase activator NlpD
MLFNDTINTVLPPSGDNSPHITGHFGEDRPGKGPHLGTDFNYKGGQNGINLAHPTVHSPVSGTVTFVGGKDGSIKIRGSDGQSHELMHNHEINVNFGDRVKAGDPIGTMGGRGLLGLKSVLQHVHYQIKDSDGNKLNLGDHWNNKPYDPLDSIADNWRHAVARSGRGLGQFRGSDRRRQGGGRRHAAGLRQPRLHHAHRRGAVEARGR